MAVIAYLDAGTGGMFLAVLAGGISGIAVLLKTYGRKITNFVLRRPAEAEVDAAALDGDTN